MGNVLELKPSDVYDFIVDALACKYVPYIAGPGGIGKSQVVHQVAKDANALMIDLRLSQMLSEDLTGLPERDEARGKATYLTFDTFPLEDDEIPEGYNGWLLFLDELPSATEEVLAAIYSLLLDRTVGGRKLHPKCLVVAAGNRTIDSAIARELPDTIITRILPAEMKVNTKDWITWACREDVDSNEAVVDYITKNPESLYAPTDKSKREENETYPSPRGWEKVFAFVNMHEKRAQKEIEKTDNAGIPVSSDPDEKNMMPIDDRTFRLIMAAVGPLAAKAFRDEYDEAIQLPFPWEIAQAPSSVRVPVNGVAKAKLTNDLAEYFMESDEQSRDAVQTYINRMGGEYSSLFVSTIKGKLGETPSEKKLIADVEKRLSIDPLLGTATGGAPNQIPF